MVMAVDLPPVTVSDVSATTFSDVANKGGIVDVIGTGCSIVPKQWTEDYFDWLVECETARRLKEPNQTYYSEQEVMQMYGITDADIEAAEDLEIDGVDN